MCDCKICLQAMARLNKVNVTDLWLLVRPSAGLGRNPE
jgi:hypothetical protein